MPSRGLIALNRPHILSYRMEFFRTFGTFKEVQKPCESNDRHSKFLPSKFRFDLIRTWTQAYSWPAGTLLLPCGRAV